MSSRAASLTIAFLLLAGCETSGTQPRPPSPMPPPPPAPSACDARLAAFAERLAATPLHAPPISLPDAVVRTLAVTSTGRPLVEAVASSALVVGPTMEVDGTELPGDDAARAVGLASHLRRQAENAQALGISPPRTLYVVAPASEPLARIRSLVAETRGLEIRLVARSAALSSAPRPARVPPHIAAILAPSAEPVDPGLRAARIAGAARAAVGTCTPLAEGMGRIAAADPAARAEAMRRVVIEGLRACACQGADVDALEAILLAILAPGEPLFWVPLPSDASGTVAEAVTGQG